MVFLIYLALQYNLIKMMIGERKNTRGRIEILASILFHCREGIKKTHIMCKANIGYEQLCYYLPNLIDTGLVTQVIENGCVIYRSTNLGREFLKCYFDIIKILNCSKINPLLQSISNDKNPDMHSHKNQPRMLITTFEDAEI
ncbi:MAG TPA: winged helix-turn-helix domain-containing protein [Nitrososphaeraceae archaeon]|jgi:predicted transcriptional regulator|nr:winged helix-turn-helix domain-containing protein [Nitrososphaeraceae archaeon]